VRILGPRCLTCGRNLRPIPAALCLEVPPASKPCARVDCTINSEDGSYYGIQIAGDVRLVLVLPSCTSKMPVAVLFVLYLDRR
jgi:hypothetical protein